MNEFRAYSVTWNRFVYFTLADLLNENDELGKIMMHWYKETFDVSDDIIVERFTDLVDKNGRKGFVGDKVKDGPDTYIIKFGIYDNGDKWEGNWHHGNGFYLQEPNRVDEVYPCDDLHEMEIIGNIHDLGVPYTITSEI